MRRKVPVSLLTLQGSCLPHFGHFPGLLLSGQCPELTFDIDLVKMYLTILKFTKIHDLGSQIWPKGRFFSDQDKGTIFYFGTQNLAAANLWMRISRSSEGVGKKTGYLDMATQRVR